MNDNKVNIPDLADEPIHFLIWQLDEIVTVTLGLIIGIIINSPIIGIVIGFIANSYYIRIREGKPKGFFIHKIRAFGIQLEPLKHYSAMQPPLIKQWWG